MQPQINVLHLQICLFWLLPITIQYVGCFPGLYLLLQAHTLPISHPPTCYDSTTELFSVLGFFTVYTSLPPALSIHTPLCLEQPLYVLRGSREMLSFSRSLGQVQPHCAFLAPYSKLIMLHYNCLFVCLP